MITSNENRPLMPTYCVAGAGAIGLTLAARLSVAGFRVTIVARGESLASIRRNGIRLLDKEGDHRLRVNVGSASDFPPQDVLFLCPKSHDMASLAEAVQPLIASHTVIVPVINGVPWWYFNDGRATKARRVCSLDPDGRLEQLIRPEQIIGTATMITAERPYPGFARTFNPLRMTVGEIDHRVSDRVSELAAILTRAGVETRVSSRIRDAVWTKLVRNLISNPLTAVVGTTLRTTFGDPDLAGIVHAMLGEILPVVAAYGARLEVSPEEIMTSGRMMGDVKTSMLQDLERGATLELASIGDAVLELAQHQGIAMPVTSVVVGLARFKGKRSDFSFNSESQSASVSG